MWEYRAAPVRAVDGDTIVLLMDTGFNGRQEEHLRLLRVRAPELSQPGGTDTLHYVLEWLAALPPAVRWPLLVVTEPNTSPEPVERRSLARYLAEVREMDWINKGGPVRRLNDDVNTFLAGHPEWGGGA